MMIFGNSGSYVVTLVKLVLLAAVLVHCTSLITRQTGSTIPLESI